MEPTLNVDKEINRSVDGYGRREHHARAPSAPSPEPLEVGSVVEPNINTVNTANNVNNVNNVNNNINNINNNNNVDIAHRLDSPSEHASDAEGTVGALELSLV